MNGFCPSRLKLARYLRAVTIQELATATGIDRTLIGKFEKAQRTPSESDVTRLAAELDVTSGFFLLGEVSIPTIDQVAFRALSRMKASERDLSRALGGVAVEFMAYASRKFSLPAMNVPRLDVGDYVPESAADRLRETWGLGVAPLPVVLHLLESKGVRVLSMGEVERTVDAFSMWDGGAPFILANASVTPERFRFNLAHELGHLVMHQHGLARGRLAEEQANAFASAFLMPRMDFESMVPRQPSLEELVILKQRWRVSLQAVIRRSFDLGLLSDWRYRSYNIEVRRTYGITEPQSVPAESSLLLRKIVQALWRGGITFSHIADELGLAVSDIDRLTHGLIIQTRPG